MRYLAFSLFHSFLEKLAEEFKVFVPSKEGNLVKWKEWSKGDEVFISHRASQSVKRFFFPPREEVFNPKKEIDFSAENLVFVGLKACDLRALKSLDAVFIEGEFEDPFYKKRRENAIVISIDCTDPSEVCFCNLMGGKPYAEEGFDLNLSLAEDGFIIESGSEKGDKLLERLKDITEEATEDQKEKAEKRRAVALQKLEELNKAYRHFDFKKVVATLREQDDFWMEESFPCVECGACVFTCPTCRCFILYDTAELTRKKIWDGCELPMFARVAGGINPRAHKFERFQNRYFCKLGDYEKIYSKPGCVGCGRCISVCPGGIDMRKVINHGGNKIAGEKSLSTH